jgi:hypothetical protein
MSEQARITIKRDAEGHLIVGLDDGRMLGGVVRVDVQMRGDDLVRTIISVVDAKIDIDGLTVVAGTEGPKEDVGIAVMDAIHDAVERKFVDVTRVGDKSRRWKVG